MANLALWNLVSELKSEKYKWVDLTHELSPETPIGTVSILWKQNCCLTMRKAPPRI